MGTNLHVGDLVNTRNGSQGMACRQEADSFGAIGCSIYGTQRFSTFSRRIHYWALYISVPYDKKGKGKIVPIN
jgi:hypothetical protein